MRKIAGFSLTSVTLLLAAISIVAMMMSHSRESSGEVTKDSVLLNSQMQTLSSALSRHYSVNCSVGAISQTDLVGIYLAKELKFIHGGDYSLSITMLGGSPVSNVSITLIGTALLNKRVSKVIASGGTLTDKTLTLSKSVDSHSNANSKRIQADATLYAPTAC